MTSTTTTKTGEPFYRDVAFEPLLRRRMFYTPSFEIYQGIKLEEGKMETKGLFDYGPPGCALQANVVDLFRKHFILEENMLEVDCTMLTPHEVLKTSGHVDRFTDAMCKDPKTGEIFRADHLVEEVLRSRLDGDKEARGQTVKDKEQPEDAKKKKIKVKDTKAMKLDDATVQEYEQILAKIDDYDIPGLTKLIESHTIKNPGTGGSLNPPVAFNLMFETAIGPAGNAAKGYLRPETAQGQFLNFQKLLEFNQNSMPFASASIGKSFRNEIAPRSGLLRVREFLMAEIEHFVDPESGKKHPRFSEIADVELSLLDRRTQKDGRTDVVRKRIGDAVASKLIDNETLGYFLARIQSFLLKIGADPKKLRFRQHMENEMAHYAADCWDAELQTSYGWIECVGCADRSAYDLTVHSNRTGQQLIVREPLPQPVSVTEWVCEFDKKKFGPRFKKDGGAIAEAIESLSQDMREKLSITLNDTGKISIPVPAISAGSAELDKDLLTIERRTRVENMREFTPNVIEPSFGIGRILYCVMEHVFWTRPGDDARGILSFPPIVAPTKVLLVPLSKSPEFEPLLLQLGRKLRSLGISNKVDDSGASIGRRYSRNDELGTPLGITIDFQSVKDNTFTLRDRDSREQVRADEDKICDAVRNITEGREIWANVAKRLPKFEGQALE